jgi:ribosomal-protein-alanine N-acetyltransferase
MEHLGTKQIETNRIILRKFAIDDAYAMYNNWANDPEVTRYLLWPHHESIEVSQNILKDWTSQYINKDFYHWAITMKNNRDEPIGSISVVNKNDKIKMVHIGYSIGRKWWNKGITSEALAALIAFFFNEVGLNRIEARHDTRNPNSGKVMMKCGLKLEGTFRESEWNNQGISDASYYAILAKDFYNGKAYD